MIDIFDEAMIQDHNSQGFDSVDSEDFDPGFGCVVVREVRTYVPPEMPPLHWSASDQWNYEESKRTEAEVNARQMEYLAQFGL